MALIVETGSGSATSESYASVAEADQRHADRSNVAWAALATPIKEAALRRATDYLVQRYRSRWKGRRVLATQALDWPRVGVVLDDYGESQGWNNFGAYGLFQVDQAIVPVPVKSACIDLALKAVTADLAPDIQRETSSESVGPLSVTYVQGAPQYAQYRAIDLELKPFCEHAGAMLVRA